MILKIIGGFILTYWPDIITAVAVILVLLYQWKQGRKDLVKKIIYSMVCKAEQLYGSRTGPIKLAEVWSNIYSRLPWILRLAFPKAELENYIEEAVQKLKKTLETGGVNLLTYAQEQTAAAKLPDSATE